MALSDYESSLPQVEEVDLLELVFEDVTDPSHIYRWERFSSSNPVLAREVLKIAYMQSTQTGEKPLASVALQKIVIDAISLAINALEIAARRKKNKSGSATQPSGDADGEDPLLLA